jgi:hypothetical protein
MTEPTETRRIIEARWALAARHPMHFGLSFVNTIDSHAPSGTEPVRPFPIERPHLMWLTRLWLANPLMFVPKSRQVMATWWASMICAWCVLFRRGQLLFQQSKKLEDAVGDEWTGDGLLGRTKCILQHIPCQDWLIPRRSIVIAAESILVRHTRSRIEPLPEGGDQIRSHTASGVVTDETSLQPGFSDALQAVMSSVRRGWWIGLTTPRLKDGGASLRLAKDMEEGQAE